MPLKWQESWSDNLEGQEKIWADKNARLKNNLKARKKKIIKKIFVVTAFCLLALPLGILAQSETNQSDVMEPSRKGSTERPLREMSDTVPTKNARGGRDFEPGRPFPVGNKNPVTNDALVSQGVGATEAVGQPKAGTVGVPIDPAARVSPPDMTGDLGPNHYVQWVNLRYSIYTVSRDANNGITGFNLAVGPLNGNTIFQGLTGSRCATDNDGDPLVQYDQAANRWVLTQFAVSKSPYLQCVAVSKTADPTGGYYLYEYSFGTDFNDFPKMGIWNDTYVITYNIFKRGRTFGGSAVCAYERNVMLTGGNARQICKRTSTSYAALLPADVEGSANPATGSAVPLMSISTTALLSWKLAVNWAAGTTTLTGPTTVAGVNAFSRACSGGTCIPQPGTTNKLDSLGDRLNYRLSYRKFGTYESMLVNHAVSANGGTGIRWYELRNATGTPTVYQQGTYSPDSNYRWMGSAAMDKTGGIAIGYNISNATDITPSIRCAFRAPGDAPGNPGSETGVLTGPGSQTGTLARWGDYSMMSVDPIDG
ncbi:MAG: hypothetical protein M3T96_11160, partial [Acidobacteriota bacterium]|nr:hypothetical protein [Acidobacteriota bacterium]